MTFCFSSVSFFVLFTATVYNVAVLECSLQEALLLSYMLLVRSKWRPEHSRYNKTDPYYLYSKLRIGHTEQCPCGTGSQTTEHMLQFCLMYEPLRKGIWPDHTPVACKLYGSLGDLRRTVTLIWRSRRFVPKTHFDVAGTLNSQSTNQQRKSNWLTPSRQRQKAIPNTTQTRSSSVSDWSDGKRPKDHDGPYKLF